MRKFLTALLSVCMFGACALGFAACGEGEGSGASAKNAHKITQSNGDEAVCDHCGKTLYTGKATYELSENKKYYKVRFYQDEETEAVVPSYYKARGDEDYLPVLEVYLGSAVTKAELSPLIEEVHFSDPKALTEITVPQANAEYKSVDGVLFNKSGTELVRYPAAKQGSEYRIPDSVTKIGIEGFYSCTSLVSVTWENVKEIETGAFSGCASLASVTLGDVKEIESMVFYNCTSLSSIDLTAVTKIGANAFCGCTALTSVSLDRVTEIGSYAFGSYSDDMALETVDLSKNSVLKIIDDNAFSNCRALTSFTIPDSVEEIGTFAFERCTGIQSIVIPNTVKTMGMYIFSGWKSEQRVYVRFNEDEIPSGWEKGWNDTYYDIIVYGYTGN